MSDPVPPLPPGATLDDELPPLPSGATLDAGQGRASVGGDVVVEAVDGDTIRRAEPDPDWRIWGIDAPELAQQGRDASGSLVPVGNQSQAALNDYLNRGPVRFDTPVHESYGRPVGRVSSPRERWWGLADPEQEDVGLRMVQQGNAYAAPEYVTDDPDYRFQLAEAERLARRNGQGVHDFDVQPPEDYRENGENLNFTQRRQQALEQMRAELLPEQRLRAQSWHNPTRDDGLTGPQREQWLEALRSGSVEEIMATAQAFGRGTDEASAQSWVAWRDREYAAGREVSPSIVYQREPKELIEGEGPLGSTGGTAATTRGWGSGFTMDGLDELGAVFDSLGIGGSGQERENIWNSDRRFADIWANNQQQNAAILGYDKAHDPGAYYSGQIAGALHSGVVLPYSAGLRTPQMAAYGAAWGAGEGFLGTDGSLPDRLTGAAIGAPIGFVADPAIAKVLDVALPAAGRLGGALVNQARGRTGRAGAEAAGGEVSMNGALDAVDNATAPDAGTAVPGGPQAGANRVIDGDTLRQQAGGADGVDMQQAGEILRREADEALGRGDSVTLHTDSGPVEITQPGLRDAQGQSWGATPILADNSGANRLEITPRALLMAGDAGEAISGEVSNPVAAALAMDAAPQPGATVAQALAHPQRLDQPLDHAARQQAAETVLPQDILPMPANWVDGIEEATRIDAGRMTEARAPNERDELQRRTVRNVMGVEVPKVGPIDLVGWLRLRGGLQDQGGELRHMGITSNVSRRGLDHVGQEHRFGPLLSDSGMTFDDAAMRAWEEGYFPELAERPTVNEFLDALRETFDGGTGRRFLPEDFAELDAFNARQVERYDYEQQLHDIGGPIYTDRGVPVGSDEPFPPVQAYEEWPSEAIERVGNIDVTRLESPQDIGRALNTTHNMLGGFDAATRGRITNAETERLASEMGMTAEQLLGRRNGQALNAEEALAARQILARSGNDLVNAARRLRRMGDDPGSEALADFRQRLARHAAIQEQVAGMTAEAGRALQQFKVAANSREVRGQVLDALVRGGGGNERLTEAADAIIDLAEGAPGKFNAFTRQAQRPRWRDKISELYINFLLSNPPTHVVNAVSNTLTSMAQIPEYATGAAIGAARRAVVGAEARERILASEVGARMIGMLQGTKEGARLFARTLRSGEPDDFTSKVEDEAFHAIGGFAGEVVRVPTRLLTSSDQFFKGIARRMELNAQAVRVANREGLRGDAATRRIAELTADPTDEMLERSLDYGKYLTFQRPLGDAGRALSQFTSNNLLGKAIIPFVRTPINLLKFATERSPAAPILREWRADFRAGGDRRDLAIARMMLGTGFAAVMYEAALDGRISGGYPPDSSQGRLMQADGWQPYSVRVGDRWISYSRLDPLSTTIGVAADMATLPEGMSERQRDDMSTMLVASIMNNLASKTWLSGVSSFTEALSQPERAADNFLERLISSATVPAGVAGAARAMDPVARERDSIGEAIQARVPGMTDELLPRRDVFGEPVALDSLGPDFLSPFWQTQARDDLVVAEMLRLDQTVSYPSRQYTVDGERRDYTPEAYNRYQEIAGRLSYNGLLGLIGSERYQGMDDEERREAASDVMREARATARGLLDDAEYQLPARGAPYEGGLPELPGGATVDLPPLPAGATLN